MTAHDPALVERLAQALHGEEAAWCGPGYGTCGHVAVGRDQAPDLVAAVLDLLAAEDRLCEPPCSTCGGRGWHTAGGNDPAACGACGAGEAWSGAAEAVFPGGG